LATIPPYIETPRSRADLRRARGVVNLVYRRIAQSAPERPLTAGRFACKMWKKRVGVQRI
jgi:hypothetical protein